MHGVQLPQLGRPSCTQTWCVAKQAAEVSIARRRHLAGVAQDDADVFRLAEVDRPRVGADGI